MWGIDVKTVTEDFLNEKNDTCISCNRSLKALAFYDNSNPIKLLKE
jgi:hypothetical protein